MSSDRVFASRIDEGAVAGCRALLEEAARRGYPLPALALYRARRVPSADWIMRVALGIAARSRGWTLLALSVATDGAISVDRWSNWRHNIHPHLLPGATALAVELAAAVADEVGAAARPLLGNFEPVRIPVDPVRAANFGSPLFRRFDDDPRAIEADRAGTPPRPVTWPGGARDL